MTIRTRSIPRQMIYLTGVSMALILVLILLAQWGF